MTRDVAIGQSIKTAQFPKRSMQLKPLTEQPKGGIKTYNYWTNFNRDNPGTFLIISEQDFNRSSGGLQYWWKFTTNLAPEDFEFIMTDKQKRRFLYQMDDFYNLKKAEAKNGSHS